MSANLGCEPARSERHSRGMVMASDEPDDILRMRGITKTFPG
jgi:hypothetical protein